MAQIVSPRRSPLYQGAPPAIQTICDTSPYVLLDINYPIILMDPKYLFDPLKAVYAVDLLRVKFYHEILIY